MDYTYAKNIIDNSLNKLENDYIVQKDYKEDVDKITCVITISNKEDNY